MTGAERMLAACRRQPVDATPVWFMRQAGRTLARYRDLRERYPILTLAKTPELSSKITLMPVEELGVDGAVLFADIMLPLEPMGVSLEIQPDLGPVIHSPIRDMSAVRIHALRAAMDATSVRRAQRSRRPDDLLRHGQRLAARADGLGRQRPDECRLARQARRGLAAHRFSQRHPGQP